MTNSLRAKLAAGAPTIGTQADLLRIGEGMRRLVETL